MIPRTNLHAGRLVDQIRQNLIGLQNDLRRNATTHKAMANAQSPNLATLQGFMTDAAASYLTRLVWIANLRADPVKRQALVDQLAKIGWTEPDITSVATALQTAAMTLSDAPKTTFAQIIAACDAVLAVVDAPDSLWPE